MAADEFTTHKLIDALKRGNTRRNSCMLSRISNGTFCNWMRTDAEFKKRVLAAEAEAENEGIGRIREGAAGWQGMAWWLQRRNRNGRWAERVEAAEREKIRAKAANSNNLEDLSIDALEKVILEAAEAKRELSGAEDPEGKQGAK